MTPSGTAKRPDCIGYLTVLSDSDHGYTGGLLVVSPSGRPLEFHCSTPLPTSRAQQLLYGPTLHPHVCGELIAPALLAEAKLRPTVLLLQDTAAEPIGFDAPVFVWEEPRATDPADASNDSTPLRRLNPQWGESPTADEVLSRLATHVPLDEPFQRVTEAVREAQRLSNPGVSDDAA